MFVLGIRTAPKEVRYALLECDGNNTAVFKNASEEHRLKFPNNMATPEEKLPWLHEEFERIFRQNTDIQKVAIKTYASMGTRRGGVKSFAEGKIQETSNTGWNEQMADAVAVAWSERRES